MTNKVIIRADRAGVFFGEIKNRENTPTGVCVTMTNCRRLWYWDGAASLSEIAVSGVKHETSKITVTVESIVILGVIEIITCTEEAIKNIESAPVWKIHE